MAEDYNRRAEDQPHVVERVVALETNVTHIKDAVNELGDDLRLHIRDESEVIKDLAVAMQSVVSATESNAKTMERVSTTLDKMADHTARVQSLEQWREKAEPNLDKAKMTWWFVTVAAVIVPGAWAVLTHFKVV